MIIFAGYLKDYFRQIKPTHFLLTSIFIAILIWLNYTVGIEKRIMRISPWLVRVFLFYTFYLMVYGMAWLFQSLGKNAVSDSPLPFLLLFLGAPFLFSLKIIHWQIPQFVSSIFEYPWSRYFVIVIELPLKLAMLLLAWFFIHKFFCKDPLFFSLPPRNSTLQPYFLILLIMIPFIVFASGRADFLNVYPKFRAVEFMNAYSQTPVLSKLLYEISYGIDFISVELFFRGFLVLCIMRFAGIKAILPMAAFYCTIHFGKPLGECISAYFGGLALGVIAYRTRSILGGLIMHLGLAYLMELGGYLGHFYINSR